MQEILKTASIVPQKAATGAGDVIAKVVGSVQQVGMKVKQVLFWNKVMEIAKYVGIGLVIVLVAYFVYKILTKKK